MLKNSRGQISIEFVLIIGFMLVLALAIAPYIGKNIELDKVMSAAKTGFIDASNDVAYNGTGNVLKFNNMTFNNGTITLSCYSKNNVTPANVNYIQSKMLANIAKTLNTDVNGSSVKGGYYTYRVNVVDKT